MSRRTWPRTRSGLIRRGRRSRTPSSPRRPRGRRRRSSPRRSVPASRRSRRSGNCSGRTPMPIRLERWIRSKLSAITARTPSSFVPFAAQSREEPDPYSLPGQDDEWDAVPRRRPSRRRRSVVSSPSGKCRVKPPAPLDQEVPKPDVGEGAADHHLVVAAARAVGVEVPRLDPLFDQPASGRAVLLDRAGRGDVVGGDRVAEHGENPGGGDRLDPGRPRPACPRRTTAGGRRSSPARCSGRPREPRPRSSSRRREKTSP